MNTQKDHPITGDIVDDIDLVNVADTPNGHEDQQSPDDAYRFAAGLAHRPSA
ncbi:hypothetical protein [Azospirillum brasilense]|uniref:hypothetical protein n=1 Tax=Azospirillum brasilense TaxID=192 RepID=UPI001551FDBC|nr:hypothetical protein [Azospirillum brasilense]